MGFENGARKKRKCQGCGLKMNMAYDGLGMLCADCLKEFQKDVVHRHRSGSIPYHEAESILMERMRFSRFQAEEVLHPALGEGDFQNPDLALKLADHITNIAGASE